ncbi:TPA: MipA/OmpV family protein [Klebsiella quasipneumoniae subsp. quasipneumoniae]|nr:MipA/OmpV family protein [Klebsiella quasipneumoniae subsp. quasipneumoniae]
MKLLFVFLSHFLFFVSYSIYSADISIGLEGGKYESVYDSNQHDLWVLPYIGYESEYFYIDGTEAGFYIVNSETQKLKLKGFYYMTEFESKHAETASLKQLNDRHDAIILGLSNAYITPYGAINAELGFDTFNGSHGLVGNFSYIGMINYKAFSLLPELGMNIMSAKHTRYYYGVSQQESERTGLALWQPNYSIVPYLQFSGNYSFTNSLNIWGAFTGRFFPSAIRNSPMVSKNTTIELTIGFSYKL